MAESPTRRPAAAVSPSGHSGTGADRDKPSPWVAFRACTPGDGPSIQRGLPRTVRAALPVVPGPSVLGPGGTLMDPSERVTWEDCPNCGRPAAVGWLNGHPIEFDCPAGCSLNKVQV